MVVFLFVIIGVIIIEFIKKRQEDQNKHREAHDTFLTVLNSIDAAIYVTDIKTYEVLFMNKYLVDKFGGNFQERRVTRYLKTQMRCVSTARMKNWWTKTAI